MNESSTVSPVWVYVSEDQKTTVDLNVTAIIDTIPNSIYAGIDQLLFTHAQFTGAYEDVWLYTHNHR